MPHSDEKQWNFKPLRDRVLGNAASWGALAFYMGTLSLLLAPATLAGVTAYGLVLTAYGTRYDIIPFLRRRAVNQLVKSGRWTPMRQSGLAHIARQMEEAYGLKPVSLYVADQKFIQDYIYDRDGSLIWRFYEKINRALSEHNRKREFNRAARYARIAYFAFGGLNAVVTTKDALLNYGPAENRLVLAHELAHIKNRDSFAPEGYINIFLRETKGLLFWAGLPLFCLGPAANSVAGILTNGSAVPVVFFCSVGTGLIAKAAITYASRIMERRADRNAIYMTRDLDAAEQKMRRWQNTKKPGMGERLFSTHPVGIDRIENYRRAMDEAKTYPPLKYSFVSSGGPSKFAPGVKPGVQPWGVPSSPAPK